jgi:hypothetical protein
VRNRTLIPSLILVSFLIILGFTGCKGQSGESYFNLPEGPKIIFRGGFGKITIKYTPPPDPIFKVANATSYIEFDVIKDQFGIPDKPIVVEYLVETSVMSIYPSTATANPRFNDYITKCVQSWVYTRFGKGQMRVMVDVAKKKIVVDTDGIMLLEAEKGRPKPVRGSPRDLVRATGFTIVDGDL